MRMRTMRFAFTKALAGDHMCIFGVKPVLQASQGSVCLYTMVDWTTAAFRGLHWLAIVYLAAIVALRQPVKAAESGSSSGQGSGSGDNSTEPIPLYFIFLSSNNPRIKTSGSIPAVDIALEMINNPLQPYLGRYSLHYTAALDSQCDRTQALDKFHDVVHAKPEEFVQTVGIVGAGCSVASIPVAEISHYYNIPMISWSSAAAELSNRQKYRKYYRPVPSEEIYSPGLAAVLRHYGWKQLAILTQTESLFLSSQKVVIDMLPDVDVTVREFGTFENPLRVDDFFVASKDNRVFVLNMYVDHAKRVLCEAYRRGLYYPRYLWFTPGWYGNMWWEKELPVNCTVKHMETVLGHSLQAVQYPIFSETEVSELGLSTFQFRQLYGLRLYQEAQLGNVYAVDLTAPLAFDAVWTLAIALRSTIDKIARGDEGRCVDEFGDLVPLEEFDYGNDKLGCLLQESMDETYFLGISGYVTFDESGDRVGNTVRVSQYQPGIGRGGAMDTALVGYAYFDEEEGTITGLRVEFATDNSTVFWPDGITPDGIPKEVIVTTALPLTVIYYIFAIVGIIFAIMCLGFNIVYRNRKIVKLTSPNLNYLIIAGAILLYVSVFFWVTPAAEQQMATTLCNFRVWLFSVGNTLCLAVVLSKMWRIHYIFAAPSPKRKPKPPQDWHLLIIISVMMAVDVIILLIPTAIDSARLRGQLSESKEHGSTKDEYGVVELHSYYRCYSDSQGIWLFISYIYKFLLQIAAIYFAFMSRKIRVKALNDSKEITAIIYITSLLLVISAFGYWIGLLHLNTSTVVFGTAQLVTATVFLGLLFIPKMISLRVDPDGLNIFSSGQRNVTASSMNQSTVDQLEAGQTKLRVRVKELEAELEKYQNGSINTGSINTAITTATVYTCNTVTPTQTSPDTKLCGIVADTYT